MRYLSIVIMLTLLSGCATTLNMEDDLQQSQGVILDVGNSTKFYSCIDGNCVIY